MDFLNTGPAVSKTLRTVVNHHKAIRKAGDLCVVDLIREGDAITGAATTRLVVNTAAAAAGVSLSRMPRSRSERFRPHCVAAKLKPCGISEADR